jgi:ankyrin repeat protein
MTSSSPANRPPEWDLLLSAAQKNLPEKIRTMIVNNGVPPSHGNVVGQTALHIAALWGNGTFIVLHFLRTTS